MLKNALSAFYLLLRWMDFNQICRDIFLREGKELIRFCDLDPIFKVTGGERMLENALSALFLLKG